MAEHNDEIERGCHYCGTTSDTRPYGPGGAPICFDCMKASPEREAQAAGNFGALLSASEAVSPTGTTILSSKGPDPFDTRILDPEAEVSGRLESDG